jgi:DNA polymerase I-like protein with 3'-5' exonuclease and polymerase domains
MLGINLRAGFDTMLAHYCLVPTTRVLKTDLTWVEVRNLTVGDRLVGFDEEDPQTMLPTTVKAVKRQMAPAYKITTAHGSVACSANHRWPCKINNQGSTKWRTAEEIFLRRGATSLMHFVDPWEVDTSYEAGYIAGIIDGEGHIGVHGRSVGFTQVEGIVLRSSVEYLRAKGFDLRLSVDQTGGVTHVDFRGSREALRAVGMFRPKRLLERADELLFGGWGPGGERGEGRRKQHPEPIVSVEYLGEQEVIGVETTTGTLVAEGFLSHNSLDESRGGHGLKILAARYLDAPDWEADIKNYLSKPSTDSYIGLPEAVLWKYSAQDGIYTWQLFELLSEQLRSPDNHGPANLFHAFLMPGCRTIIDLEQSGIYVDPLRVRVLRARCEAERNAHLHELLRLTGNPTFNPRSVQQVRHVLYEELGAPTFSQSGKGYVAQLGQATGKADEYSTGKEALERLMHWNELPSVQTFATKLHGYRSYAYTISHYVVPFTEAQEDDGRIHPSYNLTASVTGRLASNNPNVMNMTREGGVRGVIAPMPGNILVSLDYSQAELRVLAVLSNDPTLQQIYREGKDIHNTVSVWFYGEGYTPTQRVIAKAFVFGLVYGRGEVSIAQGFGLPIEEARAKMNIIFAMMPRLKIWPDELREQVLTKGYVETPLGRRRRFPGATPENWGSIERFAVNAPVQGTSSDIMLIALMRINSWLAPEFGGKVLFPLHDAIELEVPINFLDMVVPRAIVEMKQAPRRVFGLMPGADLPFEVDATVGYSLEDKDLKRWALR